MFTATVPTFDKRDKSKNKNKNLKIKASMIIFAYVMQVLGN